MLFLPDNCCQKLSHTLTKNGLIKEHLLGEADELFLSIEKFVCPSKSIILSVIEQSLLEKDKLKKANEPFYK